MPAAAVIHLTSRRYSSWSLRGWLAARHSGLAVAEQWVDIYAADWQQRRQRFPYDRGGGKVPVLVAGEAVVWNALAIVDWLDRNSGGTRFWPADDSARAFAMSAAVEMQAGFAALRQRCPMNVMRRYPGWVLAADAAADVARIGALWTEGLERFGGPWLGGAQWGAVDILYTPVASRLTSYAVSLPPAAEAWRQRAMAHPLMVEWVAAAAAEPGINPAYEF